MQTREILGLHNGFLAAEGESFTTRHDETCKEKTFCNSSEQNATHYEHGAVNDVACCL